jgi:hypothetical protein
MLLRPCNNFFNKMKNRNSYRRNVVMIRRKMRLRFASDFHDSFAGVTV